MSTLSQFLGGDSTTPIGHLSHLGIADEPATVTIGSQKWLRTGVLAPATSYPSVPTDYQHIDPVPVLHETLPQGEVYNSIVHNGTIWVAVGDYSALATSPDGVTWTKGAIPGGHYKSVIWTGTKFAACGSLTGNNGATFATSTDGITWVHGVVSNGANEVARSVAWNGSIYAIIGGVKDTLTYLRTSPDGVTWTTRTLPSGPNSSSLTQIIWTGTRFAACGYTNSVNYVITSPDGITWTNSIVTSTAGYTASQICWNGSLFVVATNNSGTLIYTSPDGLTWTGRLVPTSYRINGLVWTGSRFIGVGTAVSIGSSPILTSTDGITWSFASFFAGQTYALGSMTCLGISGSNILAIGGGANGFIARSSDGGINWTTRKPSAPFTSIAYNGSVYVAASRDKICATSTDGINWTRRADFQQPIYGIATSGSLFVAVGGAEPYGFLTTSTDGINWTSRSPGGLFESELRNIVFGNGKFVAGSFAGHITTSANGIDWTLSLDSVTAVGGTLYNISFAGGIFFAMASTTSGYSYDGITWRNITLTIPHAPVNLAWNGSLYVLVGSTICRTSPDGINWTDRSSTIPSGLTRVFVVGGTFVACGVNKFATSTDGVTWATRSGEAASIVDTPTFGDRVYFIGNSSIGSTTNTKYVGVPGYNKYQYMRVE